MILPGATVGVLGGGQLGRMFTLRARSMGYRVVVLDPDPHSPAGAVADAQIQTAYDDDRGIKELAARCAAVTTEFENVPATTLQRLSQLSLVRPPVEAVATAQDRIAEKTFFRSRGFGTAEFRPVHNRAELMAALREVPLPALLKTSRLGYDGKGQALVSSEEEATRAFDQFRQVPCVLEQHVALERELSVIVARGSDGDIAVFPLAENSHRHGILETSVVPARIDGTLATQSRDMASAAAEALSYVGVLALELFVTGEQQL